MKKYEVLVGWTVFFVECADGTYFSGLCRNLRKKLWEIDNRQGLYFSKHPERLPVKVVFKEVQLPFREAYAKYKYMKEMNRKLKKKLIGTGQWPLGGPLKRYLIEKS